MYSMLHNIARSTRWSPESTAEAPLDLKQERPLQRTVQSQPVRPEAGVGPTPHPLWARREEIRVAGASVWIDPSSDSAEGPMQPCQWVEPLRLMLEAQAATTPQVRQASDKEEA